MDFARKAGEAALHAHAFAEARHYLKLATDLLAQQPASPERDVQERDLAGIYAVALFQSLGATSQELRTVTARSTALAGRTADLGVLAIARSHAFGDVHRRLGAGGPSGGAIMGTGRRRLSAGRSRSAGAGAINGALRAWHDGA